MVKKLFVRLAEMMGFVPDSEEEAQLQENSVASVEPENGASASEIDRLLSAVSYTVQSIEGANAVSVIAHVGGLCIATGQSDCVIEENYNTEGLTRIALANAKSAARAEIVRFEKWLIVRPTQEY